MGKGRSSVFFQYSPSLSYFSPPSFSPQHRQTPPSTLKSTTKANSRTLQTSPSQTVHTTCASGSSPHRPSPPPVRYGRSPSPVPTKSKSPTVSSVSCSAVPHHSRESTSTRRSTSVWKSVAPQPLHGMVR